MREVTRKADGRKLHVRNMWVADQSCEWHESMEVALWNQAADATDFLRPGDFVQLSGMDAVAACQWACCACVRVNVCMCVLFGRILTISELLKAREYGGGAVEPGSGCHRLPQARRLCPAVRYGCACLLIVNVCERCSCACVISHCSRRFSFLFLSDGLCTFACVHGFCLQDFAYALPADLESSRTDDPATDVFVKRGTRPNSGKYFTMSINNARAIIVVSWPPDPGRGRVAV